ncbi:uncharacterized protein DNG_08310 [Cephalotrichum gorgonifer]|uniref:Uncharacterized protein n=1 Tax=Cephalotrichum gorgonifer TaxID=2041049 RepID=A0AAE8SYD3_9PEZI|nr:uncharacterized protein DNG_08310 [Cephalotrichum gorgonifer]
MDDKPSHMDSAGSDGFRCTYSDFLNEDFGVGPNYIRNLETPVDHYGAGAMSSYAAFPTNDGNFATMSGSPADASSTSEVMMTNMSHQSSSLFSYDGVSMATTFGSIDTGQLYPQHQLPNGACNPDITAPQNNDNGSINNAAQRGWQGNLLQQTYVTPEQSMSQPGNGSSPILDGRCASGNMCAGNEFLPTNTPGAFNQMPSASSGSPPEAFNTPDQGGIIGMAYTTDNAWANNANVNPAVQGSNVGSQNQIQTGFQGHNGNANLPLADNMNAPYQAQTGLQNHNGNTSMPVTNNMRFKNQGQTGFQGHSANARSPPVNNTASRGQGQMGFQAQPGGRQNPSQVQYGMSQPDDDAQARYAAFLQKRGREVLRNSLQTLPNNRSATGAAQPPPEIQGHGQIHQGGQPTSSMSHARLFPSLNRPPGAGVPLTPLDASTMSRVDLTGARPADPEHIARLFKASLEAAKSSELKKQYPGEYDPEKNGSKKTAPKKNAPKDNGEKEGSKNGGGGGGGARKKRTQAAPDEATTQKPKNPKPKRTAKKANAANSKDTKASDPKTGGALDLNEDSMVTSSGLHPSTGQSSIAP